MKFIHLSDLHLGKRVNEYSMLEDQQYILKQILQIIDAEKPDAVLISGDVYDKSVPSAEAVSLFDDFLVRLSEKDLQVMVISGNHDSPERIAFGGRLMDKSGVHMSRVYSGKEEPVSMQDEFGTVCFYLLPFVKPVHVRAALQDEEIHTYTEALQAAVNAMDIDGSERNVLLTHQFVTGAGRSDSEEISIGGSDNVDACVFDGFDYVALGHIHGPQNIGRETLRYCGTPLKYSFSEAKHQKSVTVVEMKEKGNTVVHTVDLSPLRDMREIRGLYSEITDKKYYDQLPKYDYYHITLTDEEDEPDAVRKLQVIYPNLMKLDYDNKRTRSAASFEEAVAPETKSPLQNFEEFYEKQNGAAMSAEQKNYLEVLIEKIWEDKA